MALQKNQIKFVEKNRKRYSPEKLSKEINVPLEEIQKYLEAHPAQKAPFYFYAVMFLIPVFFFVILESGLRLFNYGTDLKMWVPITDDKIIINPDVARRYFSSVKNLPATIEDSFDKEKKSNSFRVFVLGESSAAGYPFMPMGSFSRYIRKRLEISYPNSTIEVVNIGLTAVNSYTIRDFMPEVLEQKPDLVLIYTGHNEYYGALGVGSMESVGSSRTLVNLLLSMNKFKTTQLVKDFLQWFAGLFSDSEAKKASGTLMSRMAKNQYIPLGSEIYKNGLSQFEGNMRDVIEMARNANVPLILGTLTSNLKDMKPFVSSKDENGQSAEKIFNEAQMDYNKADYTAAKILFRKAKDLDALRFRASDDLNNIIKQFGKEYKIPVVDVDSAFNAVSPNGIVGNNLMTDHLHPTFRGYQLMGKVFFDEMLKKNFLPKNSSASILVNKQDSVTVANFPYSKVDSIMAEYRIRILKNDWPYIDPQKKLPQEALFSPKTFEDSIALKCVNSEISWMDCHHKSAEHFLQKKNIDESLRYMEVLIYQYPMIREYYKFIDDLAVDLISAKEFDKAYKVLLKRHMLQPNDFSTKWLGTIDLNEKRIPSAIKYLEQSVKLNPNDLQTQYNLAGAYALDKQYRKGYDTVMEVLRKNKDYPGGNALASQLEVVLGLR